MKVVCPHCQLPNFADAKECRRCAKPLPEVCHSCGHALAPGAGFCAQCGTIVGKEHVDPAGYRSRSLSDRAIKPKQEFLPHKYELRKCPECGGAVSTEAAFCTHCGHLFAERVEAQRKVRVALEEAEAVDHRSFPVVLDEIVEATPPGPLELDDIVVPGIPPAHAPTPEAPRPAAPPRPASGPAPHAPVRDVSKPDSPWIMPDTIEVPDDMVLVPGGPFLAGGEKQQKSVSDFLIDRFPVTNDEYRAYVAATGAPVPDDWLDGRPLAGKERHPVVNVSYAEAQAYAAWAGKRLPTSDEWEKAARGTDGRAFPWGDAFDPAAANCREAALNTTTPVDRYEAFASPLGACDMVGNVCEWVASDDGNLRFRGGSFLDDERNVHATSKFITASPHFKSFFIGFRCAKDAW